MLHANILLDGRVQNVGIRSFAKDLAAEMNLSGDVKYNYDGTVEINLFCHSKAELDEVALKLKKGPALAKINDLRIEVYPSDPPMDEGFNIL